MKKYVATPTTKASPNRATVSIVDRSRKLATYSSKDRRVPRGHTSHDV